MHLMHLFECDISYTCENVKINVLMKDIEE